jgi:hypothetical protein
MPTNLVKLLLFKEISIYYCHWSLWDGKILALLQGWLCVKVCAPCKCAKMCGGLLRPSLSNPNEERTAQIG